MDHNTSGRRTIDINGDVVHSMHAWRRKQVEERLLPGADHDLVFAQPDGRLTHPELVRRTFERLVARSGLPKIRLHDLKAYACIVAVEGGRAGHSRERAARSRDATRFSLP